MRTTLDINEALLKEARTLTGILTKKDLVNHSLRELIRKKRRDHLAGLYGKALTELSPEEVERYREHER
jgi:Arc/MetJ family transcription regulator